MASDAEIDQNDLKLAIEQFYEKVGLDIQFHDKGGEAKTLHWSDPENLKNHYFMDSITSDYFTTLEAGKALRLVNAVLEKISSKKFFESKECLQCGKPSKDRAFCSEKCLNDRISAIGDNKEELDKLRKIAEGKTEDSTI